MLQLNGAYSLGAGKTLWLGPDASLVIESNTELSLQGELSCYGTLTVSGNLAGEPPQVFASGTISPAFCTESEVIEYWQCADLRS